MIALDSSLWNQSHCLHLLSTFIALDMHCAQCLPGATTHSTVLMLSGHSRSQRTSVRAGASKRSTSRSVQPQCPAVVLP
ncbi:hypothetical protein M408DRAFT_90081 [Serendipita vermifera MAFF 305830]|uniref:Uncharacterized protein n=1 Tax=Serendipita vermifera MAFF 305830 TaxID=933852 RepID=A0A0C3BB83_SERVB|nr:hypothetical protein M408DRAFT_90081 [Serendipita vermifera MAFF 305830]